jgi:signal transduction histidine kinase
MAALADERQTQSVHSDASGSAPVPLSHGKRTQLAILAHDLKTPLAIIRARAQMMQRRMGQADIPDRQQIQEAFGQIEGATARMAVLLDDLIGVSAPTGPSDESDCRTTDLAQMARSLAADFQQTTDRHYFCVQVTDGDCVGRWRRVHVERILSNLLSNAIKYSPRGGEIALSAWAEVDRRDRTRWATVRISDSGIGIPADHLPHVFEAGHRARNAYGSAVGAGFGLATVRDLVRLYQGALTVKSEEGRGSSFTVRLPLEPTPAGTCSDIPLHIKEEERALLIRLLQRAAREVRHELSITDTEEVRALIKPREDLVSGLLGRVQTAAEAA